MLEGEFLEALQNADNFNVVGDMLVLNKARWHRWRGSKRFI